MPKTPRVDVAGLALAGLAVELDELPPGPVARTRSLAVTTLNGTARPIEETEPRSGELESLWFWLELLL